MEVCRVLGLSLLAAVSLDIFGYTSLPPLLPPPGGPQSFHSFLQALGLPPLPFPCPTSVVSITQTVNSWAAETTVTSRVQCSEDRSMCGLCLCRGSIS